MLKTERRSRFHRVCTALLLCAAPLVLASGPAGAEEFTEEIRMDCERLNFESFVGDVNLEAIDGDEFEITVHVRGDDASRDLIRVETRQGKNGRVRVRFPTDRSVTIVYPKLGRKKTSWSHNKRRIKVVGRGDGLEVWTDVVIGVPRGREAKVALKVGNITASDVEADLALDLGAIGIVTASKIVGELEIDTGSSDVRVGQVRGPQLRVDCGSGEIHLSDARCAKIILDTGSGDVHVRQTEGDLLSIDTGSGDVEIRESRGGNTKIDTGSGEVRVQDSMGRRAEIDVASGDIGVFGSRWDRVEIDTASGDVLWGATADASYRLRAESASGSMKVDVPVTEWFTKKKSEMAFVVRDGDDRIHIDTASGDVHVTH